MEHEFTNRPQLNKSRLFRLKRFNLPHSRFSNQLHKPHHQAPTTRSRPLSLDNFQVQRNNIKHRFRSCAHRDNESLTCSNLYSLDSLAPSQSDVVTLTDGEKVADVASPRLVMSAVNDKHRVGFLYAKIGMMMKAGTQRDGESSDEAATTTVAAASGDDDNIGHQFATFVQI